MAAPIIPSLLTTFVYPAAWTVVGIIGNAYILGGQLKDLGDQVKDMGNQVRAIGQELKNLSVEIKDVEGDMKGLKGDVKGLIAQQAARQATMSMAEKLVRDGDKKRRA